MFFELNEFIINLIEHILVKLDLIKTLLISNDVITKLYLLAMVIKWSNEKELIKETMKNIYYKILLFK